MASSSIHLAVSKLYLEKSNIIHNKEKVLHGTLYPDTVENKAISHFTDKDRGKDSITFYFKIQHYLILNLVGSYI